MLGQCIPLGGKSVWSSYSQIGSKYVSIIQNDINDINEWYYRPIIMAMANIDSTALFHDLAVGADSTVSGLVGLIGAALALQQVYYY